MINIEIENLETIDSTNDQAVYQIENQFLKSDKIIIARHQSNGHGANGHKFISDKNVGIYFSFIHFYNNLNDLNFITQKAAVAVYKTFKDIFDIELSIKWINDLYYKNKKIAGILCKNLIKHNSVIVGVGIDLFYNVLLDESIKNVAGYIFKDYKELIDTLNNNKKLSRNTLIYKRVFNDFNLTEASKKNYSNCVPNSLVNEIVENLLYYINIEGLPSLYVEKNIIKDDKIYEDCVLEC